MPENADLGGVLKLPKLPGLLQQAVALHQAGCLGEAAKLYELILSQAPRHFDAEHLCGVVALQQGRLERAHELISAALRTRPKDAAALNNLGTVHLRRGDHLAACRLFDQALESKPDFVDALINLGSALHQSGRPREAMVPLQRARNLDDSSSVVCNLLGACHLGTGDPAMAARLFEAATHAAPTDAEGWVNWCVALNRIGDQAKARECADTALALRPESSTALAARATIEFDEGQVETALDTYRRAIDLPPLSAKTLGAYANALWMSGFCDEALVHLSEAVTLEAGNATIRWQLAMCECRTFFSRPAEIDLARNAFVARLEELEAWFEEAPRRDAYTAVGSTPPFFLAYQPLNNVELLRRYGRLCSEWMGTAPFSMPVSAPVVSPDRVRQVACGDRKVRLGIASAHIRDHSVWNAITKGWVRHIDASRFELWVFHLGRQHDEQTEFAERQAQHFEAGPKALQDWVASISNARLDALIYPDIGMDSLSTQLAALRLAPVQAASWGHPETSGLPTIDLYLSAENMEPPQSRLNYTEKLVELPNLGVCVEPLRPAPLTLDLKSLGLPDDEPLLLCPGSPFKYSPLHDRIWARIARGFGSGERRTGLARLADRFRGIRRGRLVFFRSNNSSMDGRLAQRLRRAFESEKVDFDAHVCFIPYLERARFFALMRCSTLLLDTLGFSGFNNALQAIEAGLPVLAREDTFMRGRLASGIMRRLNMPECVAISDDDFVEKAIWFSTNKEIVARTRVQVAERGKILFDDVESVRAFERSILEAVIQAGRCAP